jgi:hypothetical protein
MMTIVSSNRLLSRRIICITYGKQTRRIRTKSNYQPTQNIKKALLVVITNFFSADIHGRGSLLATKNFIKCLTAFGGIEDKERALLDMKKDYGAINFSKLRTTAIDGCSERLRKMVNKPITRADLVEFYKTLIASMDKGVKPHQIKLYNIVGYPTESEDDYTEIVDTMKEADISSAKGKQWSIVLHCTPFRPMPATPLACSSTMYKDFRQQLPMLLRNRVYKGNIIYQGNNMWAVIGMGTDSLSTVFLSMIAHRGLERDTENIIKLCATPKFWNANSQVKLKTLERYFDADFLFREFASKTLPSRYLRTYAKVERMWPGLNAER